MKVYRNVSGSGDSLLVVNKETLTGSKVLTVADIVIQWLDPGGASRDVILQAEADSTNKMQWIYNDADGAGENLVVKNDGATTLATLGPGMTGIFGCDGTDWKWENDIGAFYDSISGDVRLGGGRIAFGGGANSSGIVFGNLGTATKAIDLTNCGLSGSGDYLLYFNTTNLWRADGNFFAGTAVNTKRLAQTLSGSEELVILNNNDNSGCSIRLGVYGYTSALKIAGQTGILSLGQTGTLNIVTDQQDSLADDGTISLPDATSGLVIVSCNAEGGLWLVQNDGTCTKIVGTANTADTDSDTDLCVYDSGTQAIVKNRLGAAGEIRVVYFYN